MKINKRDTEGKWFKFDEDRMFCNPDNSFA